MNGLFLRGHQAILTHLIDIVFFIDVRIKISYPNGSLKDTESLFYPKGIIRLSFDKLGLFAVPVVFQRFDDAYHDVYILHILISNY